MKRNPIFAFYRTERFCDWLPWTVDWRTKRRTYWLWWCVEWSHRDHMGEPEFPR